MDLPEGCLGDKGVDRLTGRLGESGPTWVTGWVWCSGFVGDGAGEFWGCGSFEREETLQDLRRGNGSVG